MDTPFLQPLAGRQLPAGSSVNRDGRAARPAHLRPPPRALRVSGSASCPVSVFVHLLAARVTSTGRKDGGPVRSSFWCSICPSAAGGTLFKPLLTSTTLPSSSAHCLPLRPHKPFQAHLEPSLPQPWNPPCLQKALVPFRGEWNLDVQVWAPGVLTAPGTSVSGPFGQTEPRSTRRAHPSVVSVLKNQFMPLGAPQDEGRGVVGGTWEPCAGRCLRTPPVPGDMLAGGPSARQPALSPEPQKGTCLHSLASGLRGLRVSGPDKPEPSPVGRGSSEPMLAQGV